MADGASELHIRTDDPSAVAAALGSFLQPGSERPVVGPAVAAKARGKAAERWVRVLVGFDADGLAKHLSKTLATRVILAEWHARIANLHLVVLDGGKALADTWSDDLDAEALRAVVDKRGEARLLAHFEALKAFGAAGDGGGDDDDDDDDGDGDDGDADVDGDDDDDEPDDEDSLAAVLERIGAALGLPGAVVVGRGPV